MFNHDFNAEIEWTCSSVRYIGSGTKHSSPQNCLAEDDFSLVNNKIVMGSHYNNLQMSCIMTSGALAQYFHQNERYYRQQSSSSISNVQDNADKCQSKELSWKQNDTTLGISPHYLTEDTPFLISNRMGSIPELHVSCGSRYKPHDPLCIDINTRITNNYYGILHSYHPYQPGYCKWSISLPDCYFEYRAIKIALSDGDKLTVNGIVLYEGFAGWISTGERIVNFIFEAFGYNYGFDIEWRCVQNSVPDIRETAILESEIMILRAIKDSFSCYFMFFMLYFLL